MEKKYVVSGKKGEEKYEVFTLQGEEVYIYGGRIRTVDGKKLGCSICGELKLLESFAKNSQGTYGYCKKCHSNREKIRRKKLGKKIELPNTISKGSLKGIVSKNLNLDRKEFAIEFPKALVDFETLCREMTRHLRASR